MQYILLGCLAIAFMGVFDWAMMQGHTQIRPFSFLFAVVSFSIGLNGVVSTPRESVFSAWLTALGWIGLVLFALLLIYSIFIEIPLKSTYLQSATVQPLVSSGTYALVRHPGLLWFAGFAVSLWVVHPARIALLAGVTWMAANILLIVLEDHYFFPRTIPGYSQYKENTPFIWPNRASLLRCLSTLKTHNNRNEDHQVKQKG